MPFQSPVDPALQSELTAICAFYSTLARDLDSNMGLGGKLLFAGELDLDGARLVRAGNITGAASLCATSDAAAQRAGIREGVVDFLVTSLDEALRILKNEVRKRNPVAVAVGLRASQVAAEMGERGVLPDLVCGDRSIEAVGFVSQGAKAIVRGTMPPDHQLLIVTASAGFEERALALLPESDRTGRRWLRLSPRYLGPKARRIRSVFCEHAIAEKLIADV